MVEIRHADGRIEHPSVQHERSDAGFRWIAGLGIAALLTAALIFGLVWWFFTAYGSYQARIKKSPYPLASGAANPLPAQPRLEQINRSKGLDDVGISERLAEKEDLLQRYGPTAEKGYVHIPIDRAISLLENKLPARPVADDADKKANGLIDAGEPNSGRLFRDKPQWSER